MEKSGRAVYLQLKYRAKLESGERPREEAFSFKPRFTASKVEDQTTFYLLGSVSESQKKKA